MNQTALAGVLIILVFSAAMAALVLSSQQPAAAAPTGPAYDGPVQKVYVKALNSGVYDKRTLSVKAGIPVEFHFTAESNAGCGQILVIPDFKVQLYSPGVEKVATFTPTTPGSYPYRCGMNMFRGVMEVTA